MPAPRTHIQTVNGELVIVDHAETVNVAPNIHLKNCHLIPSLSYKLLSISQLTKELNCIVLMFSNGCLI